MFNIKIREIASEPIYKQTSNLRSDFFCGFGFDYFVNWEKNTAESW